MNITTLSLIGIAAIVAITLWIKLGSVGSTVLLALVGTAIIGCFVFVHTFTAFSKQTQVATVHCSTAANVPHTMLVELNGKTYYLGGDRWMLQSSTIEVQSYLHFLGVSSGYSLTSLHSEYADANHETSKPVDLGGIHFEKYDAWMYFPIIKSVYGSAVIQNCDNRTYQVLVDTNGDMLAHRAQGE